MKGPVSGADVVAVLLAADAPLPARVIAQKLHIGWNQVWALLFELEKTGEVVRVWYDGTRCWRLPMLAQGITDIIDLDAARRARQPHLSGRARCVSCLHRWQAVAPLGTVWLECPECHLPQGRFIEHVERDGLHWRCLCGNDLFFLTDTGAYCPGCGVECKGHR